MIDQLAEDYANQPVVFLEHDIENGSTVRQKHFWDAYVATGIIALPLAMVDSGLSVYSGPNDTYNEYKAMIDAALVRPPLALITATWQRVGDNVQFVVQVTNQSGVALGISNLAQVHAIVYIDEKRIYTSRFVVGDSTVPLTAAKGATVTVTPPAIPLSGVDWSKLHFLVMADYIAPQSTTLGSKSLQAAFATEKVDMSHAVYLPLMRK